MISYKSDIYPLRCKLYHNNQSVVIAFNVKDIMLFANIIDTVECTFYISETVPCCP